MSSYIYKNNAAKIFLQQETEAFGKKHSKEAAKVTPRTRETGPRTRPPRTQNPRPRIQDPGTKTQDPKTWEPGTSNFFIELQNKTLNS